MRTVVAEVLAIDATTGQLWGSILTALGVIAAGALTLLGTFRTSQRSAASAEAQRTAERADKQYSAQVAEVARIKAALDEAEAERDQYRKERDTALEDYHRLRLLVFRAGHDPDTIGRPNAPPAP